MALIGCERQAPPADDSTPVPTPLPASTLLDRALEWRAIGNDDRAAADFSIVLSTYPDAPEAHAARFYLAESFARRGRWTSAVEAFKTFIDTSPPDDLTARALFWMARAYEEAGDWANAIATYGRYREFGTPLEPYAAIRQAAQFQALGRRAEAAEHYEYGATADIARGARAGSYEKAIALRRQLGQDGIALQLYDQLLALAENSNYRARILAEGADLALSLGREEQARAWLREIVTQTPDAPQAAAAAAQLRAASDPALTAATAARIFFTAGRYTEALPLFDEAIARALAASPESGPSDEVLELQRLRAMTLRSLGDFAAALDALAAISAAAPDSEPGRQARLDWIQTLGQSGEVQPAADGYRDYAHTYSDDPRAPVALDRAAQLLDRLGQPEEAMQVRLELGQRYPESELAPPALHTAGLYFFRAGRWDEAQAAWQRLAESQEAYEQARGAFWAGRSARQQQATDQARTFFEVAFRSAPDSYYGARAADELDLPMTPTLTLGTPISAEDWAALDTWLSSWADLPAAVADEPGQAPDVAASGFVRRALELHNVGLEVEAIGEWNDARDTWEEDPARLARLARLAHEHNVPYIALKTAEQLVALAPADASPPVALRRLIFPTPYLDLVLDETRANGVDPRLLYALLRQESLFNPGATSWVGARGLAQVMPATGEGIAQRLGVNGFQIDDLYRPHVSIRFGAFYIGQQIQNMEGSIQGGLSAYNGGLGNAQRWANGTTVADPDLFVENIDYPETRNYVKLVYGYYGAYRRLYALP